MQKSHEFPQVVCIAGFNFSLGSPYFAKYEIIIEDGQRRRLPLDSVIVSVFHSHEALHSPSLECCSNAGLPLTGGKQFTLPALLCRHIALD